MARLSIYAALLQLRSFIKSSFHIHHKTMEMPWTKADEAEETAQAKVIHAAKKVGGARNVQHHNHRLEQREVDSVDTTGLFPQNSVIVEHEKTLERELIAERHARDLESRVASDKQHESSHSHKPLYVNLKQPKH